MPRAPAEVRRPAAGKLMPNYCSNQVSVSIPNDLSTLIPVTELEQRTGEADAHRRQVLKKHDLIGACIDPYDLEISEDGHFLNRWNPPTSLPSFLAMLLDETVEMAFFEPGNGLCGLITALPDGSSMTCHYEYTWPEDEQVQFTEDNVPALLLELVDTFTDADDSNDEDR